MAVSPSLGVCVWGSAVTASSFPVRALPVHEGLQGFLPRGAFRHRLPQPLLPLLKGPTPRKPKRLARASPMLPLVFIELMLQKFNFLSSFEENIKICSPQKTGQSGPRSMTSGAQKLLLPGLSPVTLGCVYQTEIKRDTVITSIKHFRVNERHPFTYYLI